MNEPLHERLIHEAAAALPPEREDEPSSLRQDILDELADHFSCAFRREQLRTNGDSRQAETNVLQRFGDPRRIARKLWFDAMRSKLMLQKVLIGTCAVLVASCVLFGVLFWQTVTEMREANATLLTRAREANATLLEQSRQANAAVLAELKSLRASSAANDPEWNPVQIKCVGPTSNGRPVKGIRLALLPGGQTPGSQANLTTGEDGIADFGLRQPGLYFVEAATELGEKTRKSFTVLAGKPTNETIICPTTSPASFPADWHVKWPSNFDRLSNREKTWLLAVIGGSLSRVFGDDHWSIDGGTRLLAFHPDGRIINLSTVEVKSDVSNDLLRQNAVSEFLQSRQKDNPLIASNSVLAGGTYRLWELGLAEWDGRGSPLKLLDRENQPGVSYTNNPQMSGWRQGVLSTLSLPSPIPKFKVESVQTGPGTTGWTTEWTIDVPRGLVTWAKIRAQRSTDEAGDPRSGLPPDFDVYSLFSSEDDSVRFEEREPVEASRPYKATTTNAETWPAVPLIVECVSVGEAKPLAGVQLQLSRSDLFGPSPFLPSTSQTSDAQGLADFGKVPPGRYSIYSTLPWRESSQVHNLDAYGPDAVRFDLHCPDAPPRETTVEFDLTWPQIAKQHDDLWLVLELAGYQTRTLKGQEWRSSDWHLVAVHPSGRSIVWSRNPDQPYFTLNPLRDLPREATARLQGLADFTTVGTLTESGPHRFRADGRYRVAGVGIARWDGNGQPTALWEGLRDGRYTSNGHGAFFYAFREQAPMKADETLPTLGLMSRDGQPATISYTVPESLVAAALQRWDTVPAVTQSSGRR